MKATVSRRVSASPLGSKPGSGRGCAIGSDSLAALAPATGLAPITLPSASVVPDERVEAESMEGLGSLGMALAVALAEPLGVAQTRSKAISREK